MSASRASRGFLLWEYRRRLLLAASVALAVHAGIFFTSRPVVFVAAQFGHDEPAAAMEVDLVEQAQEPAPTELEPPITPPPEPRPEQPPTPEPDALSPIARPKPPAPPSPPPPRTSPKPPQTGPARAASGGITSKATASYSPAPLYPEESRAAREHGIVLLQGAVDELGRITSTTLKKSSGYPRLDRAAEEAFRRYKLKPALRNGQPISSTVERLFRFKVE